MHTQSLLRSPSLLLSQTSASSVYCDLSPYTHTHIMSTCICTHTLASSLALAFALSLSLSLAHPPSLPLALSLTNQHSDLQLKSREQGRAPFCHPLLKHCFKSAAHPTRLIQPPSRRATSWRCRSRRICWHTAPIRCLSSLLPFAHRFDESCHTPEWIIYVSCVACE